MNNWRLLLLAIVAVLLPAGSFTERNLFDGRQGCCDQRFGNIPDSKLHGHRENFQDQRLTRASEENRRFENRYGNSDRTRDSIERTTPSEPFSRRETDYRVTRIQERRYQPLPGTRLTRETRNFVQDLRNNDRRRSVERRHRDQIDSRDRATRFSSEEMRLRSNRQNVEEDRSNNRKTLEIQNRQNTVIARKEVHDARLREYPARSDFIRLNSERREVRERRGRNIEDLRRSVEREESRVRSRINSRDSYAATRSERVDERRQRDNTRDNEREVISRREYRERISPERRLTRDSSEKDIRNRVDVRVARTQDRRDDSRRVYSEERRSDIAESQSRRVREIRSLERSDALRQSRDSDRINPSERRVRDVTRVGRDNIRFEERSDERRSKRDMLARRTASMNRDNARREDMRRTSSMSRIDSRLETRTKRAATERVDRDSRIRIESRERDVLERNSRDLERNSRNLDTSRIYQTRDQSRDARFSRDNNRRLLENREDHRRAEQRVERSSAPRSQRDELRRNIVDANRIEVRDSKESMRRDSSRLVSARRDTRELSSTRRITRDSNERTFDRRLETREFRRDSRLVRDEISRNRREIRSEERDSTRLSEARDMERRSRESRERDSIRSNDARTDRNMRIRDTRNADRQIRANEKVAESRLITSNIGNLAMERNHIRFSNLETRGERTKNVLQVDEKSDENNTYNLRYVFYTLQGAYLCGLLVQILTENTNKAKSRNFSSWWNSPKTLVKVD